MTFEFVGENTASYLRLEQLLASLSEADLRRANADGWTVAALLTHLAFWDQRMLVLLKRWQAEGVTESPVDPDMINDSLMTIANALAPRAAVELCLSSAREIDAALAACSPELVAAIQASGNHFRFNRALHRDGHLREIQHVLATPA